MFQPTHTQSHFQATYYDRLASELSGVPGDIDAWEKGQSFHKKLLAQSYELADKLESVGTEAYIPQDLMILGLHSKQARKLPNFRNINFIPYVARKNRNRQAKELEYFLQENPNCRAWMITAGSRCNSQMLPNVVKKLHRKVSKINSMPFMRYAGASFVYRATEFGEVAPDGDDLSYHPHCHAVLNMTRFLPKNEWSSLLRKIQAFFGAYSQDNGRIRNARELVKYCVKPSDMEQLHGEQLKTLFHASQGLRLHESLGSFRKHRGRIRAEKLKVIRHKSGVLKMIPSWNQVPTKNSSSTSIFEREVELASDESHDSPKVLAWCVPARVFTHVTEPLFIVHGLQGRDPSSVFAWDEVRQREASIKVHTEMLTVQRKRKERDESKKKIPQSGAPPSRSGQVLH